MKKTNILDLPSFEAFFVLLFQLLFSGELSKGCWELEDAGVYRVLVI